MELRCYEALFVLSIAGFYRRKAHLVGALIVSGVLFFLFVDFGERGVLKLVSFRKNVIESGAFGPDVPPVNSAS